jgi:hypothetical protein
MHTTVDFVDYESLYSDYEEQILLAPKNPGPSSRKAKALQASATSKYIASTGCDEVEFNVWGTMFCTPSPTAPRTVSPAASSTASTMANPADLDALINISASDNLAKEVCEKQSVVGKKANKKKKRGSCKILKPKFGTR